MFYVSLNNWVREFCVIINLLFICYFNFGNDYKIYGIVFVIMSVKKVNVLFKFGIYEIVDWYY